MRACWRGPSQPCMCLCTRVCMMYPDLCLIKKVWLELAGLCKVFSEGFQLCFWWFRAEVYCRAYRAMLWDEFRENQGPAALLSMLLAALCIIIYLSLRPQTPPSHHLSCCCHSDLWRDLRLSYAPVKSAALMGKYCSEIRKFVFELWLQVMSLSHYSIFYSHLLTKVTHHWQKTGLGFDIITEHKSHWSQIHTFKKVHNPLNIWFFVCLCV